MIGQYANRLMTLHFTAALFLSAALMFSIQPMAGKMLLPIVGGTPAGWVVAMAFFQIALLAGYGLAYGLSHLSPRAHGGAFVALLLLGALFLPLRLSGDALPDIPAAGDVFILLTLSLGIPFIVMSATSTTLQRIFGTTGHKAAKDPYFLYAASNLGSLTGLFAYPFLIEPKWTLAAQSQYWLCAYCLLIVLTLAAIPCAGKQIPAAENTAPVAIGWQRRLLWCIYAFIPASLLMGYTTFITRDIYSAPLIWILPLSIYLLTFVAAFSRHWKIGWQRISAVHLITVTIAIIMVTQMVEVLRSSFTALAVHLICLGILALLFHRRLSEDRPLGSGRALAEFYLMISLGGALAGCFNAFIAPAIFDRVIELPLILIASLLLHPRLRMEPTGRAQMAGILGLFVLLAYAATWHSAGHSTNGLKILAGTTLMLAAWHPAILAFFTTVIFAMGLNMPAAGSIALERNFYGSLSVHQHMLIDEDDSNKRYPTRYISHGTTIHGYQILDDNLALTPIAYYLPLRSLFDTYEPRNVMVMGLGAGNLNCYSGPDSRFSFIEIDPAVVDMARKHFTYLSRCSPDGKEPRILMGDGRKVMEKITDEKFDMILVDVFSSDYIPAHLMTREAIRIYMDRLADGGVLLFHISNLFFDLSTPIGAAAKDLNLDIRVMRYAGGRAFYDTASTWVALSNDNGSLNDLDSRKWQRESLPDNAKTWTDDYSDFMSALLIFKDN